jgi:hypothetical protein
MHGVKSLTLALGQLDSDLKVHHDFGKGTISYLPLKPGIGTDGTAVLQ